MYKQWILAQDKEFVKEVHPDGIILDYFQDDNKRALSIEQLRMLDDKLIFNPED